MAAKSAKNFWGFTTESLLLRHVKVVDKGKGKEKAKGRTARVYVHAAKKPMVPKEFKEFFPTVTSNPGQRTVDLGHEIVVLLAPLTVADAENDGRLKTPGFARVRDVVGACLGTLEKAEVTNIEFDFDLQGEYLAAALLGLELALYRFKRVLKAEPPHLRISLSVKGRDLASSIVREATNLGVAINFARHLTSLPPNLLNPVTYANQLRSLAGSLKNVRAEIWDEKRLSKERMNLHLSVGQGSETPPRLVRLSYRPPGAKQPPIALVGKGITFDTGGLDIKPSAGMRLMKKDMGGSAAVAGVLLWAAMSGVKQPLDVYLALAENAVGSRSFRPSDVITARNGLTVEIHNTDAEGRLVLADAMDVAIKQKDKPRFLVDVATLTGAIKVALGGSLAGLFANDLKLEGDLLRAGRDMGEFLWPMPLYQKYRAQTQSTFADMVNAVDGFGGAITAALFLEKFAGDVPWAHLDIYAWKDSAEGAWLESGGSGQAVMTLTHWLQEL